MNIGKSFDHKSNIKQPKRLTLLPQAWFVSLSAVHSLLSNAHALNNILMLILLVENPFHTH